MSRKFADIHVHPSLKPYNNHCFEGMQPTIWEKYPYDKNWKDPARFLSCMARKGIKEIARESQSHLDACGNAQVKCVFLSLYPTERPFFNVQHSDCLSRLFLPKKKMKYLAQAVSGFPIRKIEKILERVKEGKGVDYFQEELLPLIDFVICQSENASNQKSGYSFKIATDYSEFKKYTKMEPKTIAGILTIEGVNSLGNYKKNALFEKEYENLSASEKAFLKKSYVENIRELKNLKGVKKYTPFFVTFCHHFNNLLAGHARSLSYGMRRILNQEPGMNGTFNVLGRKVLELLLDKENGRRILIDTKHMSIKTRQDYHRYVMNKTRNGERIPIICSHAAVNGWRSYTDAEKYGPKKRFDKKTYFSCWEINLNDEEILDIYESDGLIGVVLHEGRMPGGKIRKRIKILKKEISKSRKSGKNSQDSEAKLKQVYLELIWSNIFHIIRLIAKDKKDRNGGPANGWKIISLGSDFDGVIDSLDSFENVRKLSDLAEGMIDYINDKKNPVFYAQNGRDIKLRREDLEKLLFHKKIEDIVEDIFFNNVDLFLSKYFTNAYLS